MTIKFPETCFACINGSHEDCRMKDCDCECNCPYCQDEDDYNMYEILDSGDLDD